VARMHPALVLMELHVQHPMQVVFHRPVPRMYLAIRSAVTS
jgi:hypothetical protein